MKYLKLFESFSEITLEKILKNPTETDFPKTLDEVTKIINEIKDYKLNAQEYVNLIEYCITNVNANNAFEYTSMLIKFVWSSNKDLLRSKDVITAMEKWSEIWHEKFNKNYKEPSYDEKATNTLFVDENLETILTNPKDAKFPSKSNDILAFNQSLKNRKLTLLEMLNLIEYCTLMSSEKNKFEYSSAFVKIARKYNQDLLKSKDVIIALEKWVEVWDPVIKIY